MEISENGSGKKVGIVILPQFYNQKENLIGGRYSFLPLNVLLIYNTLLNSGIKPDIYNLNFEYHNNDVKSSSFFELLNQKMAGLNYDYIILPLSYTRDFCFFDDVDGFILKNFSAQEKIVKNTKLIFTGRIINKEKFFEFMEKEVVLFNVLYHEDEEIASLIKGEKTGPAEHWLVKDEIDSHFYMKNVLYLKEIPMITQRGCKFKCSFCQRDLIWPERKVYNGSMSLIVEYVQFFKNHYHINKFYSIDPLINSSKEYLKDLCSELKKLKIRWWTNARLDLLDYQDIKILKDSGCHRLLFGLESLYKPTQKEIGKFQDLEKVKTIVNYCRKIGMNYNLSCIVGMNPTLKESYEDAISTGSQIYLNDLLMPKILVWILKSFYLLFGRINWIENFMSKYGNYAPNLRLTVTDGTKKYFDITDKNPESFYPAAYAPFDSIFMIDIANLFNNAVYSNYININGKKIYSCKDLFQYALEHNDLKVINKKNIEKLLFILFDKKSISKYFTEMPEIDLNFFISDYLHQYQTLKHRLIPADSEPGIS